MLLFVYDMLVNTNIAQAVGLQIKNEWIAELRGQMYKINNFWFVLPIDQIKHPRGNNKILGKLYQIEENTQTLRALDAYYACVQAKLKINHSTDLYHRVENDVKILKYNTIYDIVNRTAITDQVVKASVYIGNLLNHRISKGIKDYHNREMSGVSNYFLPELKKKLE